MPTFLNSLQKEIIVQTNDQTGHPDIGYRVFYAAISAILSKNSVDLLTIIKQINSHRPHLTSVHLATLLPRAAQYTLRKMGITNYAEFTVTQWQDVIETKLISSADFIYALNNYNNSSTRPQARYRSLAAITSALSRNNHDGLIIHDWGCSLNLGLAGLLNHDFYFDQIVNGINDHTPNQLISQLLYHDKLNIKHAIGVDMVKPDVEWICACEYFHRYDERCASLENILSTLKNEIGQVQFISTDISNPLLPHIEPFSQIKNSHQKQIIYMSMVTYQMESQDASTTFNNATEVLNDGDCLITLDYINTAIRFSDKNIRITIYIKQNGELSRGFEWLLWTDATCKEVYPGVDFQLINDQLKLS